MFPETPFEKLILVDLVNTLGERELVLFQPQILDLSGIFDIFMILGLWLRYKIIEIKDDC